MRYNENDGEEINGKIVITSEIDDNPIFETSCVVVGDVVANYIRANFDLTIVGDVSAKRIEVAGKFICLGDCVCEEIAVQGAGTIEGDIDVESGFIGETLLAKNICAETLEAKGTVLCSNLECNDQVACEKYVLIAEGLTGIGKLTSKMAICGEYSMLDDTDGLFIADTLEMQKPITTIQEVNKSSLDIKKWKQMAISMKPSSFYEELCELSEEQDKYKQEAQAFHKLMLVENITVLSSIKMYVDIMDIVSQNFEIIAYTKLYGMVKARFLGFDVEDIKGAKIQGISQKDFAKMLYIISMRPKIFDDNIRQLILKSLFLYVGMDYTKIIDIWKEKNESVIKSVEAPKKKEAISNFSLGERIIVVSGVWKNAVGNINRIDENKRTVSIEVRLFGKMTTVSISMDDCKKM